MMDSNVVVIALIVLNMAQLGIVYGLVNRLVRQSGQSALRPSDSVDVDRVMSRNPEVTAKPVRPVTGSQKVTI